MVDTQKIIGVLGGSFNPIHKAHLAMATAAHRQFDIPHILIMPTASTYYKDGSVLADSEMRMDMIRLAIAESGTDDYMIPSYLDLNRGGITYTYDTINELKKDYDTIYFILGSDSLMYIDKWVRAEEFIPECIILCASRDGVADDDLKKQADYLIKDFGADIKFLDTGIIPISSSNIRKLIGDGMDVSKYVPEGVLRYIKDNHLYR